MYPSGNKLCDVCSGSQPEGLGATAYVTYFVMLKAAGTKLAYVDPKQLNTPKHCKMQNAQLASHTGPQARCAYYVETRRSKGKGAQLTADTRSQRVVSGSGLLLSGCFCDC